MQCDFPLTVDGRVQRSGYPDLRITDLESKRVFYLDPKLYAAGSRDSSFRTFYFEPKKSTNKVRDDAVHFVVGFEHAPRETVSLFAPSSYSARLMMRLLLIFRVYQTGNRFREVSRCIAGRISLSGSK